VSAGDSTVSIAVRSDRILVPLYNADPPFDALQFALDAYPAASITVLYVIDPFESDHEGMVPPLLGYWGEWYENARRSADDVLDRARSLASRRDCPVQTDVIHGRAPSAIVGYVEAQDVDHVVVTPHPRSRIRRLLSGGVALGVVRKAPVPVTVVK
jgi:nucleotide-binding universal stress UspA family protein